MSDRVTVVMFGGPRDGRQVQVHRHARWIEVKTIVGDYWYPLIDGPRGERVAVLSSHVPGPGETAK